MKYKVGDRVRIKTWEQMVKEFGLDNRVSWGRIPCVAAFTDVMEEELQDSCPDRILTVESIVDSNHGIYRMRYFNWNWSNDMIECLEGEWNGEKGKENKYIEIEIDRFSLMDFD